jgi:hypothetical protein
MPGAGRGAASSAHDLRRDRVGDEIRLVIGFEAIRRE